MKVTVLAGLLLCLNVSANCFAQADFRFYVFDETKTDKLHYEYCQDVTVYDFASRGPRLVWHTEYRVYGINQDSFTFTTQRYDGEVTPKAYAAFLEEARKLPMAGLDEKKKDRRATGSSGWIDLDGKHIDVTAGPDTEVRRRWQELLDTFLARYAPPESRQTTRRTVEGDIVEPREIDFATLLKNPEAYDGKRIRLTGYYHGEFEGSSFAATKGEIRNYDRALWRGGPSSFADPKSISRRNDLLLTIDGTFELGPGGHMGLWRGEIERVTAAKPVKGR